MADVDIWSWDHERVEKLLDTHCGMTVTEVELDEALHYTVRRSGNNW
ncbi:hypothetical protein [Streptomyces sp. NPDC056682]